MTTKKLTATQQLEKIYGPLTFGGFLNSWRLSEEMNQTQFAKFLGLSVQNLNDIEKGRRIPSPTRAAKIAKKLQLPEEGLIAIALRDSLKKEGFNFYVSLESAV
ncbi:MAG: helix-turn-helix domain-containing protein [Bdellovibrio sp.]|jgi:transcriptional regulator with XRE-family HTH domain